MLVIPENYRESKLMSIDPGLNSTGVSIWTLDFFNFEIKEIEAFTLCNNKLRSASFFDDYRFTDRKIKLERLSKAIRYLTTQYAPNQVACESPFFNRLMPVAYGSLTETLTTIKESIYETNPNITFTLLEPLLVKKTVGAGFTKGKVDVKLSVSKISEIMDNLISDYSDLDEHSIDSLAIGYTFLKLRGFLDHV